MIVLQLSRVWISFCSYVLQYTAVFSYRDELGHVLLMRLWHMDGWKIPPDCHARSLLLQHLHRTTRWEHDSTRRGHDWSFTRPTITRTGCHALTSWTLRVAMPSCGQSNTFCVCLQHVCIDLWFCIAVALNCFYANWFTNLFTLSNCRYENGLLGSKIITIFRVEQFY